MSMCVFIEALPIKPVIIIRATAKYMPQTLPSVCHVSMLLVVMVVLLLLRHTQVYHIIFVIIMKFSPSFPLLWYIDAMNTFQ